MARALAALLLAAPAWASTSGAAGVPQICTGWPSPDAPHVAATNYSNADLPDLLTLLNGSRVTSAGPLWEARRKPGGGVFWRHRLTMEESEKPPAMLYPVVRFVGKNGQPGRIKLIRPELFVRTIYLKASLERTQAGPPSTRREAPL